MAGCSESEVGLEAREHREDEVAKRGVLGDEEAGGVDVSVLQGGLLLGGDVLLLRAVPHLLQARSGRQRDVGPGAVHGLALQQPLLLLVQLRQDGHPRLVLKALSWRVGGHDSSAARGASRVHEGEKCHRQCDVACVRQVLVKTTSAVVDRHAAQGSAMKYYSSCMCSSRRCVLTWSDTSGLSNLLSK